MEHTITMRLNDIRSSIIEKIKRDHPNLCEGRDVFVTLAGEGDKTTATITFKYTQRYSSWGD